MVAITFSFDLNFCPAIDLFKFRNKKKSRGVKYGEYGGWSGSSQPKSTNLPVAMVEMLAGALLFFFCRVEQFFL